MTFSMFAIKCIKDNNNTGSIRVNVLPLIVDVIVGFYVFL